MTFPISRVAFTMAALALTPFLASSTASAQAPATKTLDQQIEELTLLVNELKVGQSDLQAEADGIQAQLSNTQKDMQALASAMVALDSQMDEIKQLLGMQTETMQTLADLQQRLRPAANEKPRLDASESPQAQSTAARPIPGREEGVLRIHNEMTSDQTIAVNGRRYRVPAETIMDVAVPLGVATTELVGFEDEKSWTLDQPGAVQEVNIYPTDRTVLRSVLTPIVYDYSY